MMTKQARRRRKNHDADAGMDDDDALMMMMIMNLPRDIIFEILSRLPIESLLQCMSVCKLWSTFRYDSNFIDLHHTKSIMHRPPTLVLITSSPMEPKDKLSSILTVSPDREGGGGGGDCRKAKPIPLGFELEGNCLDIMGSCNGFICIAEREGLGLICLCNPITRERFMLPKSHRILPRTFSNSRPINSVGFGFDSVSKKYKVVRALYYTNCYDKVTRYCEIITVGEESSWRKLEFPNMSVQDQHVCGRDLYGYILEQYETHPVLLDGTLYWLIENHNFDSDNGEYILALDIDSEKFWTIDCCPPPRKCRERRSLIQMDGSLAIVDYAFTYRLSIWSMDIWLLKGSKTMGFSFTLTTYDMERWGARFSVMAKYGQDAFLLRVWKFMKPGVETSLLLYSPLKKQKVLYVQETWKSERLLGNWIVPTLKSL
ncbi:F-box protein At5g49610-like isoform X1 [Macadamia integrifolia]|uniref:F-box protein At5g49610-like isoform X1 n=1 Tax=Macadamia integrifolia TaxID=60698 RepID=UPI001C4ECD54|nr:F-box protein At5g49610-like isoform X1 [Macadamia integrifolia]